MLQWITHTYITTQDLHITILKIKYKYIINEQRILEKMALTKRYKSTLLSTTEDPNEEYEKEKIDRHKG